ncbi:DUF3052 domain-containing protein [Rhodococcus sp. IEGM 1408]|uniref:DUF3052 domain-containing protein n=1 Tax=Rhodococcus sp. IEGM 1408 TaxID=3082220 RepID=UPI002955D82A|nr:DUF3052 domain-containing protein [Rhodococcus sp. IEGM 1408]MDV8001927.1 DUF3052 domain-containing protein [Rhodococcus sp. IEGM 1408]
MVAAANQQDGADQVAGQLELTKDMLVSEVGWDSDCDESISEAVEDAVGSELLEEDTDEVVDAVILWWRDGDGDLVDRLMDVVTPLAEEGSVWVLTPKTGTDGHVEPSVIAESAQTAGMLQTRTAALGEWAGSRLALRKKGAVRK